MKKVAVILFNLGGPDGPDAIEPFLFNLFSDPAIITSPNPIRWALAKLISKRRAPVAKKIYKQIGGKSPILDLTQDQSTALETVLNDHSEGTQFKTFVSMRYWHPFSDEVAASVKSFEPDQIVLLPLYPQYSTTTTGSSFLDWKKSADKNMLDVPTQQICCYPTQSGFIAAQADLLASALDQATGPVRVLFSAHGLPKKIVDTKKDPYPEHVKIGARAIVDQMAKDGKPIDDWQVCYQSRVGPLEWIGPSTEEEIERAHLDQKGLVIVPLAFVSEHSETLVELDIEYKQLADDKGIKEYIRVPAVGVHSLFINGLADLVTQTCVCKKTLCPQGTEKRVCTAFHHACEVPIIG